MKVLVTGSAGYIGENLMTYLARNGMNVLGIDKIYGVDCNNIEQYSFDVNAIVHLAAISGIKACEENIDNAIHDNVFGASAVFKYGEENYIPVIFASTQASKNPTSSNYAFMKYMSSIECLKYWKNMVLRFSNIYGGKGYLEKKNSCVAKFTRAVKDGITMDIDGDGTQVRDFIHVRDVCEAIRLSILKVNSRKFDDSKKIFDVGTGIGTTINRLAELFGGEFTHKPYSDTIGIESNIADTKDAEDSINFKAKISIENGVKELLV